MAPSFEDTIFTAVTLIFIYSYTTYLHGRAQMSRVDLGISRAKATVKTESRPIGRGKHNLNKILLDLILETYNILLDRTDEGGDVLGELARGEVDIADGHTDGADPLAISLGADHLLHEGADALSNSVGLETRHKALRTEQTAEAGLLEGGFGISVADQPVERQVTGLGLDHGEQGFLAEGHGAAPARFGLGVAPLLADDGDLCVVLHGVR